MILLFAKKYRFSSSLDLVSRLAFNKIAFMWRRYSLLNSNGVAAIAKYDGPPFVLTGRGYVVTNISLLGNRTKIILPKSRLNTRWEEVLIGDEEGENVDGNIVANRCKSEGL